MKNNTFQKTDLQKEFVECLALGIHYSDNTFATIEDKIINADLHHLVDQLKPILTTVLKYLFWIMMPNIPISRKKD